MTKFSVSWPLCGLVFSLLFSLCIAAGWDQYNDPLTNWDSRAQRNFYSLPSRGDARYSPWSDTYWPNSNGGIAWRWNDRNYRNSFSYRTYSRQQLQQMSTSAISRLSPAEKYDIFVGDYSYGLTNSEWIRTSPGDADWEGLCHGWAPASLKYAEPRPVTMRNRDGITIPFGSSDIKALLTYYTGVYADHRTLYKTFVGLRCGDDLDSYGSSDRACADINAGAFHVILANEIGIKGKGFVGDVDRGYQVWNQPIMGYATQVLSESDADPNYASSRAVKEISVKTTMIYGDEYGPSWGSVGSNRKFKTMYYNLELDSRGNIVGGWWRQFDRNDFHWGGQIVNFYGQFSALGQIYSASVGDVAASAVGDESVEAASAPTIDKTLTQPTGAITFAVSSTPSFNWLVSVSGSSGVQFNVDQLNTEKNRHIIKIYDGETDSAKLLAALSGSKADLGQAVIRASGQKVLIMYASMGGGSAGQQEGFSLSYKAL